MSFVLCLQKSPNSSSLWSMRYLTPHIPRTSPSHAIKTNSTITIRKKSQIHTSASHTYITMQNARVPVILPCISECLRHRYRAGIYLLHKWRISHFSSPVFRSLSVQHFQDSTPFDKPSFHKQLQHSLSSQTRLPPRLFPGKNLPERLDFSPSILYH